MELVSGGGRGDRKRHHFHHHWERGGGGKVFERGTGSSTGSNAIRGATKTEARGSGGTRGSMSGESKGGKAQRSQAEKKTGTKSMRRSGSRRGKIHLQTSKLGSGPGLRTTIWVAIRVVDRGKRGLAMLGELKK